MPISFLKSGKTQKRFHASPLLSGRRFPFALAVNKRTNKWRFNATETRLRLKKHYFPLEVTWGRTLFTFLRYVVRSAEYIKVAFANNLFTEKKVSISLLGELFMWLLSFVATEKGTRFRFVEKKVATDGIKFLFSQIFFFFC